MALQTLITGARFQVGKKVQMVTNKMDSNGPLLPNFRLIIGKCQPTNKVHVLQQ